MLHDRSKPAQIDTLISRILIGKPDLTADMLRRIVPNLDEIEDSALANKIDALRRRNVRRPPLKR
ncbi:MAG: hypothetical protein WDZ83_00255 [Rhizobiaceae bacterium]